MNYFRFIIALRRYEHAKGHPKGDASLVNNLGSKTYISFVYDQSSIPAYSLAFSRALSSCFSYLAGTSKLLSFSILKI